MHRNRFTFRMGENALPGTRDDRIDSWIETGINDGVDMSEKIKEILDAHIRGVVITHHQTPDGTAVMPSVLSEAALRLLDFGD